MCKVVSLCVLVCLGVRGLATLHTVYQGNLRPEINVIDAIFLGSLFSLREKLFLLSSTEMSFLIKFFSFIPPALMVIE